MNHRTIRILGIAPYEGMKTAMEKLAAEREDLELDVYTGDLNKGVEIARRNFSSNYDAVISRGGTAEMLQKATAIPVIEISLSVYDILRAMKLAENYSDRYAIVGFSAITDCARLLCDLLQYDIDIITLYAGDDVQAVLKSLKKKGYRMVVCDMIANTTAKKLGLNAILITSGSESIQTAFDMAVKLSRSYAGIREENSFLEAVIQGNDTITVVFDDSGKLYFSTLEKSGLNTADSEKLFHCLKKELPAAKSAGSRKVIRTINGIAYSIANQSLPVRSGGYTAFYIRETAISPVSGRRGITISEKTAEEEKLLGSFYGITGIGEELSLRIRQMSQSSQPVLVMGEEGTGKEQVIRELYFQSPLRNNPVITIDFSLCDDKSWDFLMSSHNSPFTDSNNTIVLKDIQLLTDIRQTQLISAVKDISLCTRNRVFLTCVCGPDQVVPPQAADYMKAFSCLSITLLPLRKRVAEMADMISLYLGTLNMEMAKQVVGVEEEAMELLKAYSWPSNYSQFKRVLRELAVITEKSYIQADDAAEILEREQGIAGTCAYAAAGIDTAKTLDEINQDIIQIVLRETGGNQSAAAKRLGISRTTLWRLLKK